MTLLTRLQICTNMQDLKLRYWINLPLDYYYNKSFFIRLRAAPIFSQSIEREAKKKKKRACENIGDEASGSEARKNEGLPA